MHHGDVSAEIASGLLALRGRIRGAAIAASELDESVNVACWNIREFGAAPRSEAGIHYVAEILGQFDLVAVVELRADLHDLGRVLRILGPSWRCVFSDWQADSGGNMERLGFVYDERAVAFNGLAAEVDAPRAKSGIEYVGVKSFWRAPYVCSFRSGNFDFVALACHTRWGQNVVGRRDELQMLADWMGERWSDGRVEDQDLIVMGDFNVPAIGDALWTALMSRGLRIPACLVELHAGDRVVHGSNLGENARYDQILHLPSVAARFSDRGGVLDWYGGSAAIEELFPGKGFDVRRLSFEVSDHLPIWVQVKTDIDGGRLDQIVQASVVEP